MKGMKEKPQKQYKSGGSVMPAKMGAVKTAAPSRDGDTKREKKRACYLLISKGAANWVKRVISFNILKCENCRGINWQKEE